LVFIDDQKWISLDRKLRWEYPLRQDFGTDLKWFLRTWTVSRKVKQDLSNLEKVIKLYG
jgi:hypothetical protein